MVTYRFRETQLDQLTVHGDHVVLFLQDSRSRWNRKHTKSQTRTRNWL